MLQYIDKLRIILETNNVCSSHGIDHAINVMKNAEKAIEQTELIIDNKSKECILLAALLHDADDKKFFPNNNNFENLRLVLKDYDQTCIPLIIQMVDLVASSKNGDRIPENVPEWMVYPRYADRLEAIGNIGIERCYKYSITSNNPLYTNETPYADSEEDVWKIATLERYNNYSGKSSSMIDHYYDKIVRTTKFPIRNKYFDEICNMRRKPIIDFVLMFSKNKKITNEDVGNFLK